MLDLACWLYVSMVGCWFVAACVGGPALWLRWLLLGVAVPVIVFAAASSARTVRPASVVRPLACLVAYGLIMGLASKATGLAVAKASAFGAMTFATLYGSSLLLQRFGRDRVLDGWRFLWRCLLAFSVVSVVSGRWQSSHVGLYGPTGNPNMFGSLLVTCGAILFRQRSSRKGRDWIFLLEVGAGLTLLLATRSRSAMLGVSVAAATAVIVGHGSRRWLWTAGIGIACALALIAFPRQAITGVSDVVQKTSPLEPGSPGLGVLGTRLPVWAESWDAMLAGLPLGFGWGVKEAAPKDWSFDFQSFGYGREEGTSWLPVGEELGVPGLLLVAWIWFAVFRAAGRQPMSLRSLALAGPVILFCIACFEGWFLTPGNWESMAFWSGVGLLHAEPVGHPAPAAAFAPVPGEAGS